MKFTLADPDTDQFSIAIGLSKERATEIRKHCNKAMKNHVTARITENGELIHKLSAAELLQSFLEIAEEGSTPEIVYCAFLAADRFLEQRSRHEAADIPDFLKKMMEQMGGGAGMFIQVNPKRKKKKDPDSNTGDDHEA